MGKVMGSCLCIAHVCLNMIVPSFCFYGYEFEWMNMCDLNVLCERFSHIYVYTHINDDIVNRGALEAALKCILDKLLLMIYAMSM